LLDVVSAHTSVIFPSNHNLPAVGLPYPASSSSLATIFPWKRPPGYQIVVSLCLHDFWFDNECRNPRTYIEPSLNKRLVYTQVTLSNILQRYGNKRKVDSPHCLLCNPNLKDNWESPGRPEQEEKRPLGLLVNVCYCHRAWTDILAYLVVPKGGWEPSDVQLEAAASREAFEEGLPRFPLLRRANS